MKLYLHKSEALKKFVAQNTCFEINNNELFCNFCDKKLRYSTNEGVRTLYRHMKSKTHLKASELKNAQSRLEIKTSDVSKSEQFHEDLLIALTKSNIPIFKLENLYFKEFLEKWTGVCLKDESYFRNKLIKKVFLKEKFLICEKLKNNPVYITFDETTDESGRYILNVLIGICSSEHRNSPYLLRTVELDRTNSCSVNLEIINVLNTLYDNIADGFKNVKMIVSDGAPYAIKAVKFLKELIPNIKHVICICHQLHNLCESIRNNSPKLNTLVAFLKRVLIKNRENQELFLLKTSLKLPKFPVLTRWGTWLEFVSFIYTNFEKISTFLKALSLDSKEEYEVLNFLEDKQFYLEIESAFAHYFIVLAIKNLESQSISTEKQVEILNDVKNKVNMIGKYSVRLDNILSKNPDLEYFLNFKHLKAIKDDEIFSFVPLTNVSVEVSFSNYKYIFDEKRRNLLVENIEMLLFLYYNK